MCALRRWHRRCPAATATLGGNRNRASYAQPTYGTLRADSWRHTPSPVLRGRSERIIANMLGCNATAVSDSISARGAYPFPEYPGAKYGPNNRRADTID